MRLNVAVLEDDSDFRDGILVPELGALGFSVEAFARSHDLYRRMRSTAFELLVLDVGLADEHGLDVARTVRAASPIGIVVLTGRHDPHARLTGLRESVDAWLGKPVDFDLLAATLHSVSRRVRLERSANAPVLAPPGWHIPAGRWELHAPDGGHVPLNLAERRVLTRLLATPGDPVSRDELIAHISEPLEEFDPHRLDMLVHRLRRKIEDRLGVTVPLRSVRGCGYVILNADERRPVV